MKNKILVLGILVVVFLSGCIEKNNVREVCKTDVKKELIVLGERDSFFKSYPPDSDVNCVGSIRVRKWFDRPIEIYKSSWMNKENATCIITVKTKVCWLEQDGYKISEEKSKNEK